MQDQSCPRQSCPRVVSIQVGQPELLGQQDAEGAWTTAFFKSPVSGEVFVGSHCIDGDGQADRVNHGGVDKAVLFYSAEHYEPWRAYPELHRIDWGAFGENLSVMGVDERSVCIGDVWQVGDVQFEVSQPRQPCWKLARRWAMKNLPKLVVQMGRTGWYCRVRKTGMVQAGQQLRLVSRPCSEWTIERANMVRYGKSAAEKHELAQLSTLSKAWQLELGHS